MSDLLKKIEFELNEDIYRFVESVDDLESWGENCISCPSNTLMELLRQIPEDECEEMYEKIDEIVSDLIDQVQEEMDEEMNEEE